MIEEGLESLPSGGPRRYGGYSELAATCRSKPMYWFQVPRPFHNRNQCSNFTTGVKRGEYADFRPKEQWQAAQRAGKVFVRFIGEHNES